MYNTNSSDSLALDCKTVFQKTSLRFKYNQFGIDSMGFFFKCKKQVSGLEHNAIVLKLGAETVNIFCITVYQPKKIGEGNIC